MLGFVVLRTLPSHLLLIAPSFVQLEALRYTGLQISLHSALQLVLSCHLLPLVFYSVRLPAEEARLSLVVTLTELIKKTEQYITDLKNKQYIFLVKWRPVYKKK